MSFSERYIPCIFSFLKRQLLKFYHHCSLRLPRPAIIDLQVNVKKQGLGLHTLMVECLMSEIFRSR